MGSRPRPLRQRPLLRNHRCPHGLRLLLLPVPHADGDRGPEPLRSVGATPDLTLSPTWTLCPRRAEAPGRRPCHPNWPAQPRHPPHPAPHRTAARSFCTSRAESPRGGEGVVRGRSSRSQGLRSTISMRIKKRKKEDTQAMRAETVVGEGSLPERPGAWAHTKTSWPVTSSGVLPSLPKKSCSMRE